MGQLYADQCGLVHEAGLILDENSEIVLEGLCAASPFSSGRRIVFVRRGDAAFVTKPDYPIFFVPFGTPM